MKVGDFVSVNYDFWITNIIDDIMDVSFDVQTDIPRKSRMIASIPKINLYPTYMSFEEPKEEFIMEKGEAYKIVLASSFHFNGMYILKGLRDNKVKFANTIDKETRDTRCRAVLNFRYSGAFIEGYVTRIFGKSYNGEIEYTDKIVNDQQTVVIIQPGTFIEHWLPFKLLGVK